ncbi:MAG TPA: hypothetical protein VM141_00570 [Planctomycetota bacterium]|nr:hypothetical protein [Planctomycetota bacterium]
MQAATMRLALLVAMTAALAAPALAVDARRDAKERVKKELITAPAPSENKGKTGTYQMKTSSEGNNYYVCVPKSYSEGNPAGIHLYFHGQGGHGGAANFGQWAGPFLDSQNLIGINMQYMDGDNQKDTPGKVASAIEAVLQTMADYRVIPGRGVVCSFSGGGLPHGSERECGAAAREDERGGRRAVAAGQDGCRIPAAEIGHALLFISLLSG